jgi:hypothetical protein
MRKWLCLLGFHQLRWYAHTFSAGGRKRYYDCYYCRPCGKTVYR